MGDSAYNNMKVFYHTDKIEALKNKERTAPVYVRIKPTNVCNQKCYYCVYADDQVFDNRKVDRRESIPWEKMQEIIMDLVSMGVKAVTFSGGGEPLCYHSILPALGMVKNSGLDYSVITNGQELSGEKADLLTEAKWVRISMDAADAGTYQKIRKVDAYQSVIRNIEEFAKIKNGNCTLGINFVVTKDNYSEIYNFCKQMRDIGVNNIKFSPLMVKDTQTYHLDIMDDVEELLEQAKQDLMTDSFEVVDKYSGDMMLEKNFEKQYNNCYMKNLFTVIAANQNVYFCHQKAYRPDGLIGSIENCSFKELWFSENTTRLFQNMDAKRECGFCCVFEERNILLNQLFDSDLNHINFI